MTVYRAVRPDSVTPGQLKPYRHTARPPGNVPYLVDNLWEWARPADQPCRRYSVFASPTAELALASGAQNSQAYRVELVEGAAVAQLVGYNDSKYHPECRSLPKWLFKRLGQSWVDNDVAAKVAIGRLWMPCLMADEVAALLSEGCRQNLWSMEEIMAEVQYWDDVRPVTVDDTIDPEGELFFEPLKGYRLWADTAR